MSILVDTVRISGLRGLKNIEVNLEHVTVLTGMNNSGKTSFLKAIQIALGNRQFITEDDFYVSDNSKADKIIIDIRIIPVDENNKRIDNFAEDWEILFTEDRIKLDGDGNAFIPLRTIVKYNQLKSSYYIKQHVLSEWPLLKNESDKPWFQSENGKEGAFHFEEVPFYYIDAQRDILDDIKQRSSYLGKMISKIEYSDDDIKEIEDQIKEINDKAVNKSDILSNIKSTLKELDTAMDTTSEGVDITPFTKKVRDLNKGLSIYYTDNKSSFSMEYHGMGTRSWSSLLTLKSFITLLGKNAEKDKKVFFPILAIEEPEAHLHPNAHKKLYSQIAGISGQKIISTHSPYIAASAELSQIRSFYRDNEGVVCGKINVKELLPEDIRKIERQVINTRGELFFSKAIVFFEGESEEQALPIFAESFFGKSPLEIGVDFIGVGGFGNYLPFLRVVEALNIPWVILSDAEEQIKTSVKSQFISSNSKKRETDVIVFLDDGNNFEKQLIDDDFKNELKDAIKAIELPMCQNEHHKNAKKSEIEAYSEKDILDYLKSAKTQTSPIVADKIIKSGKSLPPKITELFNKLKTSFEGGATDE